MALPILMAGSSVHSALFVFVQPVWSTLVFSHEHWCGLPCTIAHFIRLNCVTDANAGQCSGFFQGRLRHLPALLVGWIGEHSLIARSPEHASDESASWGASTSIS